MWSYSQQVVSVIMVNVHFWYKHPAEGSWSLPNGLGGGDLDGYDVLPPFVNKGLIQRFSDMYEVIQYGDLLVPEHHDPASYPPVEPFKLDRPSTTEDVCDFIVEYINSDVVVRVISPLSFQT